MESEGDHSPAYRGTVKSEWSRTATPPISIHDLDRETFTLYHLINKDVYYIFHSLLYKYVYFLCSISCHVWFHLLGMSIASKIC